MRRLTQTDAQTALWQYNLAAAHYETGLVLDSLSRLDEALVEYHSALEIRKRLVSMDPKNVAWLGGLMATHGLIGRAYQLQNKPSDAIEAMIAGKNIGEQILQIAPDSPLIRLSLAESHQMIANILEGSGRLNEGLTFYLSAISIMQPVINKNPGNEHYRRTFSAAYIKVGNLLLGQENLQGALDAYTEAVKVIRSKPASNNLSSTISPNEGISMKEYLQLSSEVYEQVKLIIQSADVTDHTWARWLSDVGSTFDRNGDKFAAHGYWENALELSEASLDIRQKLALAQPANRQLRRDRDLSYEKVGNLLYSINAQKDMLRAIERQLAPVNSIPAPLGLNWPQ